MMIDADFSAAKAAEIFLRLVRASAIEAVRFLVIDPLHFEVGAKVIP